MPISLAQAPAWNIIPALDLRSILSSLGLKCHVIVLWPLLRPTVQLFTLIASYARHQTIAVRYNNQPLLSISTPKPASVNQTVLKIEPISAILEVKKY